MSGGRDRVVVGSWSGRGGRGGRGGGEGEANTV